MADYPYPAPRSAYERGEASGLDEGVKACMVLLDKLADAKRDSAEWREQHENVLAMFRAEEQKRIAAESAVAKAQQRIDDYQGSRDYAIDLLAGALGIEVDKVRAVEYYARLAAEALAKAREGALEEAAKLQDYEAHEVQSAVDIATGAAKGSLARKVEECQDRATAIRALRSRTP